MICHFSIVQRQFVSLLLSISLYFFHILYSNYLHIMLNVCTKLIIATLIQYFNYQMKIFENFNEYINKISKSYAFMY